MRWNFCSRITTSRHVCRSPQKRVKPCKLVESCVAAVILRQEKVARPDCRTCASEIVKEGHPGDALEFLFAHHGITTSRYAEVLKSESSPVRLLKAVGAAVILRQEKAARPDCRTCAPEIVKEDHPGDALEFLFAHHDITASRYAEVLKSESSPVSLLKAVWPAVILRQKKAARPDCRTCAPEIVKEDHPGDALEFLFAHHGITTSRHHGITASRHHGITVCRSPQKRDKPCKLVESCVACGHPAPGKSSTARLQNMRTLLGK